MKACTIVVIYVDVRRTENALALLHLARQHFQSLTSVTFLSVCKNHDRNHVLRRTAPILTMLRGTNQFSRHSSQPVMLWNQ